MNIIKNFAIFKAKPNENTKLPTHSISAKIGDEYVVIGGCWTKDGTNSKYLSAKLSDAWVNTEDNTKSRKSYVIVAEEDLIELKRLAKVEDESFIDPKTGVNLRDIAF
jgi:hypothetical protein